MNLAIPSTNFFQDIAGTDSTTIANKHIIYNLTAVSTYLDSTVSCQLLSGLVGRWDLPIQKGPTVNSTKEFGTAREVLMKM